MRIKIKNVIRRFRIFALRRMACLFSAKFSLIEGAVCIIAPHPDDEVLGCAGLIQRLCQQGAPPHVVVLTGGGKSHSVCCNTDESLIKGERRKLASCILCNLGLPADRLHLLDFPDGTVSLENIEMERLENILQKIEAKHIFIPHHGEGWPDHLIVKDMIQSLSVAPQADVYEYCVWLWYYNVWNLDWKNAFLLSLSAKKHKKKEEAVRHYIDTLAPCGRPWSGVLPTVLTKACLWHKELFFKIRCLGILKS